MASKGAPPDSPIELLMAVRKLPDLLCLGFKYLFTPRERSEPHIMKPEVMMDPEATRRRNEWIMRRREPRRGYSPITKARNYIERPFDEVIDLFGSFGL